MSSSESPDYLAIGFEQIESDLQLLMEAFAEVLRKMGLETLAEYLPWQENSLAADASSTELPPRLGLAYSVAFQLLNMVEEHAAAMVREERENYEGLEAERGLWGSQLSRLKTAGMTEGQIAALLPEIRIEPVLTAHPTEAKRLSVLDHHHAIFDLLQLPKQTSAAKRRQFLDIKASLERLWRTGEILLEKPTLIDERRNVLHYFREIFPSVLPVLDERLKLAWKDAGFNVDTLRQPGAMPKMRYGTWVGGDRDGHPGVTAEVTRESLERLRTNALIVHHRNLTELASKLTLTVWMQTPPAGLLELRGRLIDALGMAKAQHVLDFHTEEPWRQVVELMLARLPVTIAPGYLSQLASGDGYYHHAEELAADLAALRDSLAAAGAHRLVEEDVEPVQRALEVFGFHLAQLDIRQNSEFHAKALTQLMRAAGVEIDDWEAWSEEDRLTFLVQELQSPRPFVHPSSPSAGPEADTVLACYRVVAEHIDTYGAEGLGALIISMTRRLSDLLVVYVLAREAGLLQSHAEGNVCLLPVVPLFETADDLERGPEMLSQFLKQPVTARSLVFQAQRKGTPDRLVQQVMVGYSDSNKDAGILASQWALHQAQMNLAKAAAEAGVHVQFFHGKGGTVSRGAGPTHRFLDALPHGSLSGDTRLTEQGETIAQKYANLSTAAYNMELLLAGVTATTALHRHRQEPQHALTPLAEKLAEASRVAYRKLLEADGFMSFYRQATPIDALEHSRIGSRPSRRTGQATLADLRAIPWVFSWNQCRFYVPGWYGAGSGLAALSEEEFARLAETLRTWPFLHYVITNVESSLASTDRELMSAYADLVEDPALRVRLFGQIMAEYDLTKSLLEKLLGGDLASKRPRMYKTLNLRAEALKVLHHQQIALLRQWRGMRGLGDEAQAAELLPDVLLSINAIASGLRTTG